MSELSRIAAARGCADSRPARCSPRFRAPRRPVVPAGAGERSRRRHALRLQRRRAAQLFALPPGCARRVTRSSRWTRRAATSPGSPTTSEARSRQRRPRRRGRRRAHPARLPVHRRRPTRCGINLDIAPSADVNTADDNPVIGTRSFGARPRSSPAHRRRVRRPAGGGRGRLRQALPRPRCDPAGLPLAVPLVDASLEMLRERELVPFRAAIEAGTRSVMTAHVASPPSPARFPRRSPPPRYRPAAASWATTA